MRFASLGSGSKGNGTLVEWRDTSVLVDCGFSLRESTHRLGRLGCHPEELTAILVTHEHGDHLRGVLPLARRFRIPVMMTAGTALAAGLVGDGSAIARHAIGDTASVDLRLIEGDREFGVGDLGVMPVPVPHDAREPVQFVFSSARHRFGLLTDLGSITQHVVASFGGCDGLLLEANHDIAMLAEGVYPPALKRRVGGSWGHLNNTQAAVFLGTVDRSRLQTLVLGHISQHNNLPERVAETVAPWTKGIHQVAYACQNRGFPWLSLEEH